MTNKKIIFYTLGTILNIIVIFMWINVIQNSIRIDLQSIRVDDMLIQQFPSLFAKSPLSLSNLYFSIPAIMFIVFSMNYQLYKFYKKHI